MELTSVAQLADRYDAFLLDQFGVLHDGKNAIDGAVACYDALAAAGKKLVVLSNTSRRRATALKKLPSLGFSADALAGFVCSGEEAYAHMAEQRAGQRFCWWSWEDDYLGLQNADYCDGLGLTLAPPAGRTLAPRPACSALGIQHALSFALTYEI